MASWRPELTLSRTSISASACLIVTSRIVCPSAALLTGNTTWEFATNLAQSAVFPRLSLLDEETRQPLAHRVGLARSPLPQPLAGLHAELAGRDFFAEERMRARG